MRLLCSLLLSVLASGLCLAEEDSPTPASRPQAEEPAEPGEDAGQQDLLKAESIPIEPGDEPLLKLLKERYNSAAEEVAVLNQIWEFGQDMLPELLEAIRGRLVPARLELCKTPAEKVEVLKLQLAITRQIEQRAKQMHEVGEGRRDALPRARYLRLDVEIQLLRAQQEAARTR